MKHGAKAKSGCIVPSRINKQTEGCCGFCTGCDQSRLRGYRGAQKHRGCQRSAEELWLLQAHGCHLLVSPQPPPCPRRVARALAPKAARARTSSRLQQGEHTACPPVAPRAAGSRGAASAAGAARGRPASPGRRGRPGQGAPAGVNGSRRSLPTGSGKAPSEPRTAAASRRARWAPVVGERRAGASLAICGFYLTVWVGAAWRGRSQSRVQHGWLPALRFVLAFQETPETEHRWICGF